jgi:uncharacterized alkaline shock family protein YloU
MENTSGAEPAKPDVDSAGASSGGVKTPNAPGRRLGGAPTTHAALTSEHGATSIADTVVAKIAGMAAQEIPGVHSMGTGFARRMGQVRSMVPGTADTPVANQGVSVEVGEREAAIDLDLVTWYGQSIVEVTEAVRDNVLQRVGGMTGLKVVEVNINVDDIYVEGEREEPRESRVR